MTMSSAAPGDHGSVIDWKLLLGSMDGDEELLDEIVAVALVELPQMIPVIDRAVCSNDSRQLITPANGVKGALRVLHARTAFDVALRLESMARSGNIADFPRVLDELKTLMPTIVGELRKRLEERKSIRPEPNEPNNA